MKDKKKAIKLDEKLQRNERMEYPSASKKGFIYDIP